MPPTCKVGWQGWSKVVEQGWSTGEGAAAREREWRAAATGSGSGGRLHLVVVVEVDLERILGGGELEHRVERGDDRA